MRVSESFGTFKYSARFYFFFFVFFFSVKSSEVDEKGEEIYVIRNVEAIAKLKLNYNAIRRILCDVRGFYVLQSNWLHVICLFLVVAYR